MVNIQNINGTNWYLVARGLEKNIFADIIRLQMILTVVGVATLLVIGIVMVAVIRRITNPIQKLTGTIVAVTEGDFTTDIEVKGSDEVTVMAGNMKEFLAGMRQILSSIITISNKIDDQAKASNQVSSDLHDSAVGQADAMGQMRTTLETGEIHQCDCGKCNHTCAGGRRHERGGQRGSAEYREYDFGGVRGQERHDFRDKIHG